MTYRQIYMTMWRFIITQILAITLVCNESFATHEIFRVPLGLSSTFKHQHLYVQPPQQLIVYPQLYQASMPHFYHSPQSSYIPQNTYSPSRYIIQSTGGIYDPIVSYIHHQNPHQISSFMNFNLGKKFSDQQPTKQNEMNPEFSENSTEVPPKSEMEYIENSRNEQSEKSMKETLITSDNSMETTEVLESMKDETNKESTTEMFLETEVQMKD